MPPDRVSGSHLIEHLVLLTVHLLQVHFNQAPHRNFNPSKGMKKKGGRGRRKVEQNCGRIPVIEKK